MKESTHKRRHESQRSRCWSYRVAEQADFFGWSLKLGTHGKPWEASGRWPLDTGCSCHRSCRQRRRWQGRCWTPWVQVVQRKRQRRRHINEAQKKMAWPKKVEKTVGNITWKHLGDPTFRTITCTTCTVWLKSAEAKEDLKKLANHSVKPGKDMKDSHETPNICQMLRSPSKHFIFGIVSPQTRPVARPADGQGSTVEPVDLVYYTIMPYNHV